MDKKPKDGESQIITLEDIKLNHSGGILLTGDFVKDCELIDLWTRFHLDESFDLHNLTFSERMKIFIKWLKRSFGGEL